MRTYSSGVLEELVSWLRGTLGRVPDLIIQTSSLFARVVSTVREDVPVGKKERMDGDELHVIQSPPLAVYAFVGWISDK